MFKQALLSFAATTMAGLAFVSAACAEQTVDFNRDVRPILSNKCFACHGPDDGKREANLRLDDVKISTRQLESGVKASLPGDPDASEVVHRITAADEAERMPPAEFAKPLSSEEI